MNYKLKRKQLFTKQSLHDRDEEKKPNFVVLQINITVRFHFVEILQIILVNSLV